ncbi:hypothetical protein [Arthrobacter sp. FW306-2-2C-D06B]|uniref:hypothetical protein n=1 Tax=Arthrobacter sp. FW306-2-2C-D06B TaxID=2879618 RepID=UPI001F1E33BE|nr:hypothetical protein [Arthrobacter sp. FW306-2-2C-D06B]UKA58288.1 hypothetical protein LFT47_18745 [Arthrobacter sp. FW306-2-2C-D06B]
MLRPVVLAAFGALAWLLWLAGPSQATDALPTIPAVPSPSVSLPPVPLTGPVGSLVNHVQSAAPSGSQVAAIPETVVNQLREQVLTPVVGAVNAVPRLVENTIKELPALPEPPSVPALPPLPPAPGILEQATGILQSQGPSVPVVPTTLLSPSVQSGSGATTSDPGFTRNPAFMPDGVVFMPPAVLATADVSPVPGGPPPDTPVPASVSPPGAGSTSSPEGASAFSAADLPEQRAQAPPPRHGPIPDRGQSPSDDPAFDPGSSPD